MTMKKFGWGMTALFAIFMLAASVAPKLLGSELATAPLVQIGWSPDYALLIGALELLCVVLFVMPRTALLGAVFMTALLGGALASHLRVDSPLFGYTLFSVYLGVFMWVALWLREEKIRKVFPVVNR